MHVDEERDTEITLGTGKMLALFFGLVILCAVFFGMGFSMGKNSVRSAPELLPSPTATHQAKPAVTAPNVPASDAKPVQAQNSPDESQSAAQTPSQQPSATQPPAEPGAAYYVQVAAVSKQEDAEALVESLKGRQYSALITNSQPTDKLFHVQVGPFTDIKEAESVRTKLISDGYNPILKK